MLELADRARRLRAMSDVPRRPIRVYDVVLENGCTLSPFVWRIKYAIAHKGFDMETVPVAFTGIKKILDGQYSQVPVIDDNGTIVADSWAIADYLDHASVERPLLFRTRGEHVWARFFDRWIFREVVPHMYRCYALDNYNFAQPVDRDYLRESRERTFLGGRRLEDAVEGREKRLPAIRDSLQPLRVMLGETPWLGGLRPNYVDFCGLSVFLWAAAINTMPPLEKSDPLLDWLNRGFDLYGGVGRDERLRPLVPGLPTGRPPEQRLSA
jgi:glutathione S-transferase